MRTNEWDTAHDWLRSMRFNHHIEDDELFDFLMDVASEGDIQARFGSFMDDTGYFNDQDEDDGMTFLCPECQSEVSEADWTEDENMCNDCVIARESQAITDEDLEDDPMELEPALCIESATQRWIWLEPEDFDYMGLASDFQDANVYPWEDASTPVDRFGTPCRTA